MAAGRQQAGLVAAASAESEGEGEGEGGRRLLLDLPFLSRNIFCKGAERERTEGEVQPDECVA